MLSMSRLPNEELAMLRETLREIERGDECDGGWLSIPSVAVLLNEQCQCSPVFLFMRVSQF